MRKIFFKVIKVPVIQMAAYIYLLTGNIFSIYRLAILLITLLTINLLSLNSWALVTNGGSFTSKRSNNSDLISNNKGRGSFEHNNENNIGAKHEQYVRMVEKELGIKKYYLGETWLKKIIALSPPGYHPANVEKIFSILLFKLGADYLLEIFGNKLEKSNLSVAKYLLAKKYFMQNKNEAAISVARTIPEDTSLHVLALQMEGVALIYMQRTDEAMVRLVECGRKATDFISSLTSSGEENQAEKLVLEAAYNQCVLNIARLMYAGQDLVGASNVYQGFAADSIVWPEVVIESAWVSFYLHDYNRTLGKLSLYETPLLKSKFNPEVVLLQIRTYLEMCKWSAAKRLADNFVMSYEKDIFNIREELQKHHHQYGYFYQQIKDFKNIITDAKSFDSTSEDKKSLDLMYKFKWAVISELSVSKMLDSLQAARKEHLQVEEEGCKLDNTNRKQDKEQKFCLKNIERFISTEEKLVGRYVERRLSEKLSQFMIVLKQINYIRLEILSRKNISPNSTNENFENQKNDINSLPSDEEKYFWTFDGEIWKDEIGDYVFALGSECR